MCPSQHLVALSVIFLSSNKAHINSCNSIKMCSPLSMNSDWLLSYCCASDNKHTSVNTLSNGAVLYLCNLYDSNLIIPLKLVQPNSSLSMLQKQNMKIVEQSAQFKEDIYCIEQLNSHASGGNNTNNIAIVAWCSQSLCYFEIELINNNASDNHSSFSTSSVSAAHLKLIKQVSLVKGSGNNNKNASNQSNKNSQQRNCLTNLGNELYMLSTTTFTHSGAVDCSQVMIVNMQSSQILYQYKNHAADNQQTINKKHKNKQSSIVQPNAANQQVQQQLIPLQQMVNSTEIVTDPIVLISSSSSFFANNYNKNAQVVPHALVWLGNKIATMVNVYELFYELSVNNSDKEQQAVALQYHSDNFIASNNYCHIYRQALQHENGGEQEEDAHEMILNRKLVALLVFNSNSKQSCSSITLPVHKFILAIRSPMLLQHAIKQQHAERNIVQLDFDVAKHEELSAIANALVEFMYTNTTTAIDSQTLAALLKLAQRYEILSLALYCMKKLKSSTKVISELIKIPKQLGSAAKSDAEANKDKAISTQLSMLETMQQIQAHLSIPSHDQQVQQLIGGFKSLELGNYEAAKKKLIKGFNDYTTTGNENQAALNTTIGLISTIQDLIIRYYYVRGKSLANIQTASALDEALEDVNHSIQLVDEALEQLTELKKLLSVDEKSLNAINLIDELKLMLQCTKWSNISSNGSELDKAMIYQKMYNAAVTNPKPKAVNQSKNVDNTANLEALLWKTLQQYERVLAVDTTNTTVWPNVVYCQNQLFQSLKQREKNDIGKQFDNVQPPKPSKKEKPAEDEEDYYEDEEEYVDEAYYDDEYYEEEDDNEIEAEPQAVVEAVESSNSHAQQAYLSLDQLFNFARLKQGPFAMSLLSLVSCVDESVQKSTNSSEPDIKFVFENSTTAVYAHKCFLTSQSSYFQHMFEVLNASAAHDIDEVDNKAEQNQMTIFYVNQFIPIAGVTPKLLTLVLYHMYTMVNIGQLVSTSFLSSNFASGKTKQQSLLDEQVTLLSLADFLGLDLLKYQMESIIMNNIETVQQAHDIYQLFQFNLNLYRLLNKCYSMLSYLQTSKVNQDQSTPLQFTKDSITALTAVKQFQFSLNEDNANRYLVLNGNASASTRLNPSKLHLQQDKHHDIVVTLNSFEQKQQFLSNIYSVNNSNIAAPSCAPANMSSTMWITKPLFGTCFFTLKFKMRVTIVGNNCGPIASEERFSSPIEQFISSQASGNSSSNSYSFAKVMMRGPILLQSQFKYLYGHSSVHNQFYLNGNSGNKSIVNLILQDQSPYVTSSNSNNDIDNSSTSIFGLDSKQIALEMALLSTGPTKMHLLRCMNQTVKNLNREPDEDEILTNEEDERMEDGNQKATKVQQTVKEKLDAYNNTLVIDPVYMDKASEVRQVEATVTLIPSPFAQKTNCFCLAVLTNTSSLDEETAMQQYSYKNTNIAFIEPLTAATLAHKLKHFNHYFGLHVAQSVASVEIDQFDIESFTAGSDECQRAMKRVAAEATVKCVYCKCDIEEAEQPKVVGAPQAASGGKQQQKKKSQVSLYPKYCNHCYTSV